ncbi:hypothetical protein PaeCFBP13512_19045 [Paenibacillus sp. CFBP13512]|uniref:hypothetical protein n=1 Tax=Paenibacillus sp. CFBP13512 TaxID=2184007 RepID=UPI0010C03534|nr:hypothetical protein [Paenibacillus sp. CFBP13512]TKJ87051.1 hypothetical protein PaeCFBP13512_19045 [Paenibacillus sp. CFBP13512]
MAAIFCCIALSVVAYQLIQNFQLKKAIQETDQYLTTKYKEEFTVKTIRKEFLMQKYFLTASADEKPSIKFNVSRGIRSTENYEDTYLSSKWYTQSVEIIQPILDDYIKSPGFAFIIRRSYLLGEYGNITEDFEEAQIKHPQLSKVDIQIAYLVNKQEIPKYNHLINELVSELKNKKIKSLSMNIHFYDKKYYADLNKFQREFEKLVFPSSVLDNEKGSTLTSNTIIKERQISFGEN